MSVERGRAAAAAARLLEAQALGARSELIDLELAAWLVAREGGKVPRLADPTDDLHVRQSAALAAGEFDAAEALLDENLDSSSGKMLLFHACHLAGSLVPDRLIAIAQRHRGAPFNGRMLSHTEHPERLLALFAEAPVLGHQLGTIAELVIRGRDVGAPIAVAEARWAGFVSAEAEHLRQTRFREGWLRIMARESPDEALELLGEMALRWGCETQPSGAAAVLARLVREDPARAAAFVEAQGERACALALLEPLVWWFDLPPAVEPIVRDLVASCDADEALVLARTLTRVRACEWLDCVTPRVSSASPLILANELAPNIASLRDAGFHDDAERARERVLPLLAEHAAPGEPAPRDLFEVVSAADLPLLVPWPNGTGLP